MTKKQLEELLNEFFKEKQLRVFEIKEQTKNGENYYYFEMNFADDISPFVVSKIKITFEVNESNLLKNDFHFENVKASYFGTQFSNMEKLFAKEIPEFIEKETTWLLEKDKEEREELERHKITIKFKKNMMNVIVDVLNSYTDFTNYTNGNFFSDTIWENGHLNIHLRNNRFFYFKIPFQDIKKQNFSDPKEWFQFQEGAIDMPERYWEHFKAFIGQDIKLALYKKYPEIKAEAIPNSFQDVKEKNENI